MKFGSPAAISEMDPDQNPESFSAAAHARWPDRQQKTTCPTPLSGKSGRDLFNAKPLCISRDQISLVSGAANQSQDRPLFKLLRADKCQRCIRFFDPIKAEPTKPVSNGVISHKLAKW
jgi:hypothetical protein